MTCFATILLLAGLLLNGDYGGGGDGRCVVDGSVGGFGSEESGGGHAIDACLCRIPARSTARSLSETTSDVRATGGPTLRRLMYICDSLIKYDHGISAAAYDNDAFPFNFFTMLAITNG